MSDFVKKIILLINDYNTFKFKKEKKCKNVLNVLNNIILPFIQNIYVENNYEYIVYMKILYTLIIKI